MAAPGDRVPLPNASFERGGKGGVDSSAKAGLASPGGAALLGLPDGWNAYQWGNPADSRFAVAVEKGAGRRGSNALRAHNLDPSALAGVYTHVSLAARTYRLTVWARAEKGQWGKGRAYLANTYSRPFRVGDRWTRLVVETTLSQPLERAEVNVQNATGRVGVLWFDDLVIEEVPTARYDLVPDTRPQRPRMLLFSPMNVNYLRDTAAEWAQRGLRGFLFDGIMASWPSDVWATDGDATTRGEDDALFREVRACNQECRKYGIDSNFVKVAFYDELPDWFDDAAWARLTANFREGARFARLSGCAGVAIDTEYIAQQYSPEWPGYQKAPRPLPELKAKVRERWRHVVSTMLREYPEMVLLTLPEGMLYYGELWGELFLGMLEACAEAKAPGGLHVMTEGTYHLTNRIALAKYPAQVTAFITEECPKRVRDYWQRRCSVVLGIWPLGYYRAITDEKGEFLGWSGKEATFGNKIVGSYADKSEWYPVADFREQVAGVNTFSPRYAWIYGHGAVLWQWTEEQARKYGACAHKAAGNATLPTVLNLSEYFEILARPLRVVKRQR